ncbi:hypothetical protein AJ79_01302 [Helicocarpus griseus UAMH5409]|uniref:Uncharacterized protein n=1 Tax=Helicocarpus griseus UAMH5409 TaxID=1447875 RepID=A0A2B7XZD3_9EURO|nr:hypothetical protein AJ79_01302 [Helicocarpus griseus UAMH5409]
MTSEKPAKAPRKLSIFIQLLEVLVNIGILIVFIMILQELRKMTTSLRELSSIPEELDGISDGLERMHSISNSLSYLSRIANPDYVFDVRAPRGSETSILFQMESYLVSPMESKQGVNDEGLRIAIKIQLQVSRCLFKDNKG